MKMPIVVTVAKEDQEMLLVVIMLHSKFKFR